MEPIYVTPREQFTAKGRLTKHTGRSLEFDLGRLMVQARMSGNWTWGELTEGGDLITNVLGIQTVENVRGYRFLRLTAGPLVVSLAWV